MTALLLGSLPEINWQEFHSEICHLFALLSKVRWEDCNVFSHLKNHIGVFIYSFQPSDTWNNTLTVASELDEWTCGMYQVQSTKNTKLGGKDLC